MRALPVVLAIVLAACARPPEAASQPPAPAATPSTSAATPDASTPPSDAAPATESAPPPGASAKRAPPQPGELISPVVAFRADGPDWSLRIENTEGYAHDVELQWDGRRSRATGKLDFQPETSDGPAPRNGRIVLQGQLDTTDGPSAMVVEITNAACKDPSGAALPQQVKIDVAGMPPLRGCGELAK